MRLSNLKIANIIGKNGKNNLENVVFIDNDTDINADIGVVFGGPRMIPYRADGAVKLYKEGLIKKILVTGGIWYIDKERTIPEAQELKDYLISKEIEESDIIVENQSRETIENAKNSIKLLKGDEILTLISSEFHIKRCYAAFGMYYNPNNLRIYGVKDEMYDKDNWMLSSSTRHMILLEAAKLKYYSKKGDILNLEINVKRKHK